MSDQAVARRGALFGALLVGAGVAVALGVFGRVHEPTYGATWPAFGFSSTATFKAWTGTAVVALALAQLMTALWLYGRLPGARTAPAWLGTAHRLSGTLAFVLCRCGVADQRGVAVLGDRPPNLNWIRGRRLRRSH